MTRVFKLFPRLRGAAEHTPDPSGHDCEPDSELEVVSIPSLTKVILSFGIPNLALTPALKVPGSSARVIRIHRRGEYCEMS